MDEDGREVYEGGCLINGRGLVERRGGGVVSAALEGSPLEGSPLEGRRCRDIAASIFLLRLR